MTNTQTVYKQMTKCRQKDRRQTDTEHTYSWQMYTAEVNRQTTERTGKWASNIQQTERRQLIPDRERAECRDAASIQRVVRIQTVRETAESQQLERKKLANRQPIECRNRPKEERDIYRQTQIQRERNRDIHTNNVSMVWRTKGAGWKAPQL